jgi:hypothetical protein
MLTTKKTAASVRRHLAIIGTTFGRHNAAAAEANPFPIAVKIPAANIAAVFRRGQRSTRAIALEITN